MFYSAFQLTIESEIDIPEMLPVVNGSEADLVIKRGKTPERLVDPNFVGVRFQVCENEMLMQVDNIARFWVREGKEIIVEPFTAEEGAIRLFLLGSALGVALLQQKKIVMHGSAIIKNNCAIALCGQSGTGKSTLSQAFCQKGYKLLADDLCVIEASADHFYVAPSFPQNKLWPDSLEYLNIRPKRLKRVRQELSKRIVPSNCFHPSPSPLKAIFVLRSDNLANTTLIAEKGINKTETLRKNSYRPFLIPRLGLLKSHFEAINKIGQKIPVYKLTRPMGFAQTVEVMDRIEEAVHE